MNNRQIYYNATCANCNSNTITNDIGVNVYKTPQTDIMPNMRAYGFLSKQPIGNDKYNKYNLLITSKDHNAPFLKEIQYDNKILKIKNIIKGGSRKKKKIHTHMYTRKNN